MANDTQQASTPNEEAEDEAKEDKPTGISMLEWIVAVVGLVILVGMIGYLLWQAAQDQGRPPSLTLTVEAVAPVHGGYVAEINVLNEGDQTAADVTIVGQLLDGETVAEEREMTLDYVPPRLPLRGQACGRNHR